MSLDAVNVAHAELRKLVRGRRKAFTQTFGKLATAFNDVMKLWDEWRAASVREVDPIPMPPLADRIDGLERVLRDVWPKGREQVWRYLCDRCDDSGWVHLTCTPETPCGRPFRLPQSAENDWTGRGVCTPNHSYVRPCFCAKGQPFAAALSAPAKPKPEDFKNAARSKPTRIGR